MQQDSEPLQFYFKAVTPEGSVFSGQLGARSRDEALTRLKNAGCSPLNISNKPVRDNILSREISFGSKVFRLPECTRFCRELAILLQSGLDLQQAVRVIEGASTDNDKLRRFSLAIRQGLRLGNSFRGAIEQSGFRLPAEFAAIVEVGEKTGTLAQSMSMLAELFEQRGKFRSMLTGAALYPAFLLVVAILVLAVLGFFVAPNLAGLFASLDKPAPFVLLALDTSSHFLQANGLYLGLISAACIAAIATVRRQPQVEAITFRLTLALPAIGPIVRWSMVQRFSATLRLYLSSRLPISDSIAGAIRAANIPGETALRAAIVDDLNKGNSITRALEKHRLFPKSVISLIKVGEESAQLPRILGAVNADASDRVRAYIDRLSAILAPALILLVGAVVGGVVFSVFSSLLEINQLVY